MTRTFSIYSNSQNLRSLCKLYFNAYGYTMTERNPDIIILDNDKLAIKNIEEYSYCDIVVVIAFEEAVKYTLPDDVLFFTRPLDVAIMVETVVNRHTYMKQCDLMTEI